MKRLVPVIILLVASCTIAGTTKPLIVGDGQIDGRKISPYELTWQQCSLTEGNWVSGGELVEQVVIIGKQTLRLRHIAQSSGRPTTVATKYFERASFAPIRTELVVIMPDGTRKPLSVHELDPDGYTGWSALGGKKEVVQGKINSRMLDATVMGAPLATLGYQESPLEFQASMMRFNGTYRVIASWVGTEVLEHNGQQIEAWLVDVEWHHNESGDVYPPGPDASGGRYWIVSNPPEGFPSVPRYQTDTYAVEFIRKTCPK